MSLKHLEAFGRHTFCGSQSGSVCAALGKPPHLLPGHCGSNKSNNNHCQWMAWSECSGARCCAKCLACTSPTPRGRSIFRILEEMMRWRLVWDPRYPVPGLESLALTPGISWCRSQDTTNLSCQVVGSCHPHRAPGLCFHLCCLHRCLESEPVHGSSVSVQSPQPPNTRTGRLKQAGEVKLV